MKYKQISIASLIALVCSSAHAQFPGDLFFKVPSVVVESGVSGSLDVEIFTGDRPFGATHFELSYDRSLIQIEDIVADSDEFDNKLSWTDLGGNVGAISVNSSSYTEPFGSVSLATIYFKALGQSGTTSLSINVIDSIDTDHQSYSSNIGYSAEINISSPLQAQILNDSPIQSEVPENTIRVAHGEIYNRVLKLKPVGEIVLMYIEDENSDYIETPIQAIDNSIETD
jgi:hypothetical protein